MSVLRCIAVIFGMSLLAVVPPAGGSESAPAPKSLPARIEETAGANRLRLDHAGGKFSGPAWDALVGAGAAARFFLLGEEHGIAENPKLAAELFGALAPKGYGRFVIEVSPPMARALDRAAGSGLEGLLAQYAKPGGVPAFFGMKEEAEMLVAVRSSVSEPDPVLWGVDYEVGGDRLLISELEGMRKPDSASAALAALRDASDAAWAKYEETRGPQYIFSFSGDPALVRSLREAWPRRSAVATEILDALEETLEINRLWVAERGWESNARRAEYMRRNFAAHWTAGTKAGKGPRVFAKMGASHMLRGRSMTEVYDLGSLIHETAALHGDTVFHLLVLPGSGSRVAVFNPSAWRFEPGPPKDSYMEGLEPITKAAFDDAFTLIDLRPLRPLLGHWRDDSDPNLMRVVHGFDAVLILSGSTPSTNLLGEP